MNLLSLKNLIEIFLSLTLYSQYLQAGPPVVMTECYSVDGTTRLRGLDPASCVGLEDCVTEFKTVRILTDVRADTGRTTYEEVEVGLDVEVKETILQRNPEGYLAEITITRTENGKLPMPVFIVNAFDSLTLKYNCTKFSNFEQTNSDNETATSPQKPAEDQVPSAESLWGLAPNYFETIY